MKICPKCNEEIRNDNITYCPVCDTKLENEVRTASSIEALARGRSGKWVIVLCIILGVMSLNCFGEGRYFMELEFGGFGVYGFFLATIAAVVAVVGLAMRKKFGIILAYVFSVVAILSYVVVYINMPRIYKNFISGTMLTMVVVHIVILAINIFYFIPRYDDFD